MPAHLKLKEFYTLYVTFSRVVELMRKSWESNAEHWAWWGRLAILDRQGNTNNLAERGFGTLKWVDSTHVLQHTWHFSMPAGGINPLCLAP